MTNKLANIKIILVEPAGPLNVGSVARVMKNMGLCHLILVNPHCDYLGEEARRMAVHGVEVLDSAQVVNSLPEALQECHRAIATTARTRDLPTPLELPRDALPWLLEDNLTTALIFGPEDRGLSNQELNYAQRFMCIRANPEYPSLNLAQAVAVCTYELYQIAQSNDSNQKSTANPNTNLHKSCTIKDLEGYYGHLESVLLKMGYLYPHTASARMEKFRCLFNKANLTQEEVTMLRGILSQMDWALQFLPEIDQK